ncbi:ABC transporter substrate-binding protein [Microlunatus speluncae]|uniref:ABC transporter substrate-binding protein n=1 Tax=Microlunatus speluncae TaxID=2594267 RepID=UPI0012664E4B|nr:ABC transporter substrate-binding protein [Microlunatus speluncae]
MRRSAVVFAAIFGLLVALAGCGSGGPADQPEPGSGAGQQGFPLTVRHALGETTLDRAPERVLTWGWGSTDAALALGVVPVAVPAAVYGGNADQVLPWNADQLAELGAETPTLLSNPDGGTTIPFEEIAAATPDVILAVYSGITAEDYEKLSAIAPTIAYPDQPWSTPWRDVVTTVGQVLGRSQQATDVLAEISTVIKDAGQRHPELAGKSVITLMDDGRQLYVYKETDPRVEFLTELGLTVPPVVTELPGEGEGFYGSVSYEKADTLVSDVLMIYAETDASLQATLARPSIKNLPQIERDGYAPIVGRPLVAAGSPPTALSLTWSLDAYLKSLASALNP